MEWDCIETVLLKLAQLSLLQNAWLSCDAAWFTVSVGMRSSVNQGNVLGNAIPVLCGCCSQSANKIAMKTRFVCRERRLYVVCSGVSFRATLGLLCGCFSFLSAFVPPAGGRQDSEPSQKKRTDACL